MIEVVEIKKSECTISLLFVDSWLGMLQEHTRTFAGAYKGICWIKALDKWPKSLKSILMNVMALYVAILG